MKMELIKLPSYRNQSIDQLTGFYLVATLTFKELNKFSNFLKISTKMICSQIYCCIWFPVPFQLKKY